MIELAIERHFQPLRGVILRPDGGAPLRILKRQSRAARLHIAGASVADGRDNAHAGDNDAAALGHGGNVARVAAEHQTRVVAAEGKGVIHHRAQRLLLRLVRAEVESTRLLRKRRQILLAEADGRRHNALGQRLDGKNRFHRARRAETMPGQRLGGADAQPLVLAVKDGVQRQEFRLVVFRRAGAVSVDIVNVRRAQTRMRDRVTNGADLSLAVGTRCGDVVRVAADTRAEHLAVDVCAARHRVLIRLDDHDARALAQRDAVRVVERRAGVLVQRVQRQKARIGHRRKRVRAARHHHVRTSGTDEVGGIGDADRARRARIRHIGDDAARATQPRHVVGDRGDGHFQNVGAVLTVLIIILDAATAADATAHNDADAAVPAEIRQRCVRERLARRLEAERGAAVEGGVFAKPLHLRRIVGVAVGRIHRFRVVDAAAGGEDALPALLHIITDGADDAETGDNAAILVVRHRRCLTLRRAPRHTPPTRRCF